MYSNSFKNIQKKIVNAEVGRSHRIIKIVLESMESSGFFDDLTEDQLKEIGNKVGEKIALGLVSELYMAGIEHADRLEHLSNVEKEFILAMKRP